MCDSEPTLGFMLTKPLWRALWRSLITLVWLASVAGATSVDVLRVVLMALPWFANPWVWVAGLTLSTAVLSFEFAAWWFRRQIKRVEMIVNSDAMLFDDPNKLNFRQWAHTVTIQNAGTEDIDAKGLVKVIAAWNEVGYSLAWLPFVLRPVNQIREDRNRPFNLRRGELKTIVVGFSFTLAGPRNWVEFVDGKESHRVTFDDFLTTWLVVRIVAFGGGRPVRVTGIFTLKDRSLSFRPRRSYEVITKSLVVAKVRFAYRRFVCPIIHYVRQKWRPALVKTRKYALLLSGHIRRLLKKATAKK